MVMFRILVLILLTIEIGYGQVSFTKANPGPPAPPFQADFSQFGSSSMSCADVNGDGTMDVLISGSTGSGFKTELYLNINFERYIKLETTLDNIAYGDNVFFDIDNDCDEDILLTGRLESNSGPWVTKLYENDGTGVFQEITNTPFSAVNGGQIKVADIDVDGDMDLFLTGPKKLYSNDGGGIFSESLIQPVEGMSTINGAFGDINGDGYVDLLIAGSNNVNYSPITKLYLNDGTGAFESISHSIDNFDDAELQFVDVDLDFDLDLVIQGHTHYKDGLSGGTVVYINDGSGNFSNRNVIRVFDGNHSASYGLTISNINNDSYPDFLVCVDLIGYVYTSLYINNGDGTFKLVSSPIAPAGVGDIESIDVDGDGDNDEIVSGSSYEGLGHSTRLYLNDGQGTFEELIPGTISDGRVDGRMAFADLDGDNDIDALLKNSIYLNDGMGLFEDGGDLYSGINASRFAVADVDGDNDIDVMILAVQIMWTINQLLDCTSIMEMLFLRKRLFLLWIPSQVN